MKKEKKCRQHGKCNKRIVCGLVNVRAEPLFKKEETRFLARPVIFIMSVFVQGFFPLFSFSSVSR